MSAPTPANANASAPATNAPSLVLPESPLVVAGVRQAAWLDLDGEIALLPRDQAALRARETAPVLCHAPATARRLGIDLFPALDLLELFAFVRPAAALTPTPRGLAALLGLPAPSDLEHEALVLREAMILLLRELSARGGRRDPDARPIAWTLARAGWRWGPAVLAALGVGRGETDPPDGTGLRSLAVWEQLPEWQDSAPEPPPGNAPVSDEAARHRLAALLGSDAEARPQQADYASAVAQAFQPRDDPEAPRLVLAEAGTGVGKTLGYLAPASLWAEANKGPVWISTFTRNLQHQIDGELDRLFPEPRTKAERVVIRKGRENYLCLLNFEQLVQGLGVRPADVVAAGLIARWATRTRDGDMVGGDLPGWLPDLLGRARSLGLTDRRGECIYAACQHYRKCYIERTIRRARQAELVIANHALVLTQAAMGTLGGGEDGRLPSRYVFDEGHHLFQAADSAFAVHLSGQETRELRRWLLGGEGRSRGATRIRGLKRRLEDLVGGDEETLEALEESLRAARALPAEAWLQRLADNAPQGPVEAFLGALHRQVYARAPQPDSPYSLETEAKPPIEGLLEMAHALDAAMRRLLAPLTRLERLLAARLDDEAKELEAETRRRVEASCRSLKRRAIWPVSAWREMLAALEEDAPEDYVDWFAVERIEGRDIDVGFYRHWVDPTIPLAEAVMAEAQGLAITSATLTDGSGAVEADWAGAEMRSGAVHLAAAPIRARVPSPFDYGAQTRVFIVNDVRKDNLDQVAAAYRELFLATGGGGLGLFTAISRLRAVYQRIAGPLEEAGLPLYAQHVDRWDSATLVDIFRAEVDSCLLGTDAMRDGIDVPGAALRLIVFDRVPWPRPDIRHKARRERFGGRRYDDRQTRLRLKQAYGRLIRRADDRGVFVLLDPMMPSRLMGAFPEDITVRKCGLAAAIAEIEAFFGGETSAADFDDEVPPLD
ncbi:MAG: ATP-dependent DNA helicase [Kiloniellales bacterium]|nr:ATP-dependent DNA helicase [Kiloniellales bacterium]